jgi:probable phosphoglycerate mutase
METILYCIRHGETEWNRTRRIQGHSDIPLSEEGIQQAVRLARFLEHHPFHAIYSSDLKRAYETARHLGNAVKRSVTALPDLRERSYGELEGLTDEEMERKYPDARQFPEKYGAESLSAIKERARTILTRLAEQHSGQQIAVVSHGGFINAFLHHVTRGEQGTGITRLVNTAICVFSYRDGEWKAVTVNDTTHLEVACDHRND